MALDSKKIKFFWDSQAKKVADIGLEGISNLEEDPTLLEAKIAAEKSKVMKKIDLDRTKRVLDLGAGAGQWSFRFAEVAKEVVAVEYSTEMCNLAQTTAAKMNLKNIEFVVGEAQNYQSDELFDFIFISGLLIYLNDEECELLVSRCAQNLKPGGDLFLRDGTGIKSRFDISNQYSIGLNAYYSATYRTSSQYINLFVRNGFSLLNHEDMFDAGSPLNKWHETRLRVYQFLRHG